MQDLAQIIQIARIRVRLEVLRQAAIHLEAVGYIVLPDDRVSVAVRLLREESLQIVHDGWIDCELGKLRFEHRRHFVLRPLHGVLEARLHRSDERFEPV